MLFRSVEEWTPIAAAVKPLTEAAAARLARPLPPAGAMVDVAATLEEITGLLALT